MLLLIIKSFLITLLSLFALRLISRNSSNLQQKIIICTLSLCLLLPLFSLVPFSININQWFQTSNPIIALQATAITNKANETTLENTIDETVHKKINLSKNNSNLHEPLNYLLLLLIIWCFGVGIRIIQCSLQFLSIKRLVSSAKPFDASQYTTNLTKNINCVLSCNTQVPFLFVTFNSINIILPEKAVQWDNETITNVITHELCHYQRKDHLALWVVELASIIYWFQPIIIILKNKHKICMELACDHSLLSNGMNPQSYAKTLLAIPQNNKTLSMVANMSSQQSFLKNRILAVINVSTNKLKFNQLLLLVFIFLQTTLIGCVNNTLLMTESHFYEFLSYQLPSFRQGTIESNTIQISTVYDGKEGNTFLELEFYNKEFDQSTWLKLGPLKKFNDNIQTWHYETLNHSELTGRYKVSGVIADGAVDGIALGIIYTNQKGEMVIHKSKGPMSNGYPNIVCSWPLDFKDSQLKQWTPQQKSLNAETIKRLICGAQLLQNGEYSIN